MPNPTARNISPVPGILQDQAIDFHRNLLLDRVRTDAFRRAIVKTVKPGDLVCDVGAGTGILSMFAAQAGATHVYAIESNPIAIATKRAVLDNGMGDRITVLRDHSFRVSLPTSVDVVVSECIGWMMYVGQMFSAVIDARDRFLRLGGTVIPRRVSLFAAPVESLNHYRYAEFFRLEPAYELNLSAFSRSSQAYVTAIHQSALMADPVLVDVATTATGYPNEAIDSTMEFEVLRDSTLHGFGLWFDADLCDGVGFSTAPGEPGTIWQQSFIGCGENISVKRNSKIVLRLQLIRYFASLGQHLDWTISVHPPQGGQPLQRHFSTAPIGRPAGAASANIDGREWLEIVRSKYRSLPNQKRAGWLTNLARAIGRGQNNQ